MPRSRTVIDRTGRRDLAERGTAQTMFGYVTCHRQELKVYDEPIDDTQNRDGTKNVVNLYPLEVRI